MVRRPSSFRSIIELWPTHAALAADIGAPVTAIPKWSQRDRIPSEWWASILNTRTAKGAGVDAVLLASLAAREVPTGRRFAEARA
jgi:hypothetical protein